jgi:hypothetical protein
MALLALVALMFAVSFGAQLLWSTARAYRLRVGVDIGARSRGRYVGWGLSTGQNAVGFAICSGASILLGYASGLL